MDAFDLGLEGDNNTQSVDLPSLFTLKKKGFKDDTVFKWCRNAKDVCFKLAKERQSTINENFDLYKGVSHLELGYDITGGRGESTNSKRQKGTSRDVKMVINHGLSTVTNLVARMKRFGQKAAVMPANADSPNDREDAKILTEIARYIEYKNNYDLLTERLHTYKYVAGDAYMFVEWDPDEIVFTKKGKKALGDVKISVPSTKDVWMEPTPDGDYSKSRWVIKRCWEDVDELIHDYEGKEDFIRRSDDTADDEGSTDFGQDPEESEKKINSIPVYYLWHKKDKYLKEGRYIVFTEHGVLKQGDLPYDHGQLPVVRLTGIQIDGENHSTALFTQGKHINNAINNLYSMAYSNQAASSKPKWLVHESSGVSKEELGNARTLVKWRGHYKPELATYSNTPTEVFNLIQDLTERHQQIMGVFGVSRGEPPPGIRAGIALQFLNEQENELLNQDVKKYKEFVRQMWILIIETAGQYYEEDEERILQILGENNQYKIELIKMDAFTTPHDVRIQDTGDLPESKAAKTQMVLDIDEKRPMKDEQFFEYLGMSTPEAFISDKARAKQKADLENQAFAKGKAVPSPQLWENQLAHYDSHMVYIQGPEFEYLTDEQKQAALDHVAATEMIIMEKAFFNEDIQQPKNPAMVEALSQYPNFPLAYVPKPPAPPTPPPPPPAPEMMPPEAEMLPPGAEMLPPELPIGPPQMMPPDDLPPVIDPGVLEEL